MCSSDLAHVGQEGVDVLGRGAVDADLPLLVYPNWGRVWDSDSYTWSGAGVDSFAPELVERWRAAGARALGGCCGIGPRAIAQSAAALRA